MNGTDHASDWVLNGSIAYKDASNVANPVLGISGFTDLAGGTGDDTYNITDDTTVSLWETAGVNTFRFAAGKQLDGVVSGGVDATDRIDLSNYTSLLSAQLASADTTGYSGDFLGSALNPVTGGFYGIDSISAGSASDTLTGLDVASTWDLGVTATYTDNSLHVLAFSSFESLYGLDHADTFNVTAANTASLHGGGGADAFNVGAALTGTIAGDAGDDAIAIGAGGSVSGAVSGGTGTDTLGYAGHSAVAVVLTGAGDDGYGGTDGSVTGGFDSIDALAGSGNADSLTGMNVASTWA
ncbi:MAG: hypothetical protein U0800_21760 [Isosphaeraceae bacterium]